MNIEHFIRKPVLIRCCYCGEPNSPQCRNTATHAINPWTYKNTFACKEHIYYMFEDDMDNYVESIFHLYTGGCKV